MRNCIVAGSLLILLTACGRKGALENPPTTNEVKKDEAGKPANRPFVLDPLLK